MAQMVESGTMTREEREMQRAHETVLRGIQMYEQNPDMFSTEQIRSLMEGAQALGISWSPQFSGSRALKKGIYELGEGLTFGLLPNSLDPGAFTPGEQIAGGIGGILGLVGPGLLAGGAVKYSRAGLNAIGKGLEKGAVIKPVASALRGRVPAAFTKMGIRGARGLETALRSPKLQQMALRAAASKWGLRAAVGLPTFAMTNRMFDDTGEGM